MPDDVTVVVQNLGPVTAYGYAKSNGYDGTENDFAEQQAQYAENAALVAQAKIDAVNASDKAAQWAAGSTSGVPSETNNAAYYARQARAAYGAPLTAFTVEDMTDTTRVYVYTGATEETYTNGDWYYWNGEEWADGGVYNTVAVELDDALESATKAAQGKAAGDAINAVQTEVDGIKGDIYEDYYEDVNITVGDVREAEDGDNVINPDFAEYVEGNYVGYWGPWTGGKSSILITLSPSTAHNSVCFITKKEMTICVNPDINYYAIWMGFGPTLDNQETIEWNLTHNWQEYGSQNEKLKYAVTSSACARDNTTDYPRPTPSAPLTIPAGTLVVVSLTKNLTPAFSILHRKMKVDTGIYLTSTSSSYTLTSARYSVVFSKINAGQNEYSHNESLIGTHWWNITDLKKGDGSDVLPSSTDIIGVIKIHGHVNHLGGVHKNEVSTDFRVLADGKDVSGGYHDSIHIIMVSDMYRPYDEDNPLIDLTSPVAKRFVEFVFTPNGWTCRNTYKLLQECDIEDCYVSGLFGFKPADVDGAYTNVGNVELGYTGQQCYSKRFREITINFKDQFTVNIHSDTAELGWVTWQNNKSAHKMYFASYLPVTTASGTEYYHAARNECLSGRCEYRF